MSRQHKNSIKIQIFSVNDVYIIDNFPKFRTLIDDRLAKDKPDAHFVTLPGDFLSPSALSNFDRGAHMVEALNTVGFSHICLGNHEFDIPCDDLRKRTMEIECPVLASNFTFGDYKKKGDMGGFKVSQSILDKVETSLGELKVGWLGYCTMDTITQLASRGHLGKYPQLSMSPTLKVFPSQADELYKKGADVIILQTHLDVDEDRKLCKLAGEKKVPIILGGHDHDVYHEKKHGVTVIKAGIDATNAIVATLILTKKGAKWEVSDLKTELIPLKKYPVSEENKKKIGAIVKEGEEKLKVLGGALLVPPIANMVLTSKEPRHKKVSVATLFCDLAREYFEADCCMINGGTIRMNRDYPDGLTLTNIQSELPFRDAMHTVSMTAGEIEEVLRYCATERKGTGGYMQHDSLIQFDEEKGMLKTVNSTHPTQKDKEKKYVVALPISLLNGMDSVEPVKKIGNKYNTKAVSLDGLMALPDIVVRQSVLKIWDEMHVMLSEFKKADKNDDGALDHDEFATFAFERKKSMTPTLVDLFFTTLDDDNNDRISVAEFVRDEKKISKE
ncbi:hypothetical protein AAMO2058_000035900 [Amorphochlora amoebiformis]